YPLFFIIGVYGGFLHVGVGYYLLATVVLGLGLDLMRANVMKNLLVMLYVPFSLVLFIVNDEIAWKYGLIHAIGNVIGAFVASRIAIKRGADVIRWIMIVVIALLTADMAGLINIKSAIGVLLAK
ncbi:MAG TPA: TSUP family transporter, partial [Bacteroidales bacterium]|nr:TSUP family transporter [Bacteroidales bacterium]